MIASKKYPSLTYENFPICLAGGLSTVRGIQWMSRTWEQKVGCPTPSCGG